MNEKCSKFEHLFSIPELFENLNYYTDTKTTASLMMSSDVLYNQYIFDKFTVRNHILKLLKELRLSKTLEIHPDFTQFSNYQLQRFYHDLLSIHSYFVNLNVFDLPDVILHLVHRNRNSNTSYQLFEQILTKMNSENKDTQDYIFNRNPISYNQYYEIINYCDRKQLILFFQYNILSTSVLSAVIKQLLNKHEQTDLFKLQHCLKSLLLKTTFGHRITSNDTYFINDILSELIKTNQVDLIRFLFQKRNFVKKYFDYQFLILKSIELDKIDILQLILELETSLFLPYKKTLFITSNIIYSVCERGSFNILGWIIENQLGRLINLDSYIRSIYSGITSCNSTEQIRCLLGCSSYFYDTNKSNLNKALYFLYEKLDSCPKKRLYF